MFNSAVLSFCVLSDGDQINIVIACLVTFNGATGPHIGVQVEHPGSGSNTLTRMMSGLETLVTGQTSAILLEDALPS